MQNVKCKIQRIAAINFTFCILHFSLKKKGYLEKVAL
jgi:hypothetical protein